MEMVHIIQKHDIYIYTVYLIDLRSDILLYFTLFYFIYILLPEGIASLSFFVEFAWPKRQISFYAFIMNDKIL